MEFQTPHTMYKAAGNYLIQTKEWGREYLFDHWAFSGDIDVADPLNLVTNITLKGEGILKAIFVPIKVKVNICEIIFYFFYYVRREATITSTPNQHGLEINIINLN